jgi:hypothetical protein
VLIKIITRNVILKLLLLFKSFNVMMFYMIVAKKKPCWVRCSGGEVPDGALSGGSNHQGKVYVARVEHNRALIPGKFIPSYNSCYASSNGKEILKRQFEVRIQ